MARLMLAFCFRQQHRDALSAQALDQAEKSPPPLRREADDGSSRMSRRGSTISDRSDGEHLLLTAGEIGLPARRADRSRQGLRADRGNGLCDPRSPRRRRWTKAPSRKLSRDRKAGDDLPSLRTMGHAEADARRRAEPLDRPILEQNPPLSRGSKPAKVFASVVLPAPLAPISPRSPRANLEIDAVQAR